MGIRRCGIATARKVKRRLTREERGYILAGLAQYRPLLGIKAEFEQKYGREISWATIRHYSNHGKWTPVIERIREKWLTDLSQVPIARKRQRLEYLQELYDEAREVQVLKQATKNDDRIVGTDRKAALSAIRLAREEIEGPRLKGAAKGGGGGGTDGAGLDASAESRRAILDELLGPCQGSEND